MGKDCGGIEMKLLENEAHYVTLEHEDAYWLFSYTKTIAKEDIKTRKITLDEKYWNYSKTTARDLNRFLNHKAGEVAKKVKSGEYELEDLNV